MINVFFKGKDLPLELSTEDLDQLYDLFKSLEYGPDVEPFPSLLDEDGELIQFNSSEIMMVTAPTHMLDDGRKEILEEENRNN